MGDSVEDEWKRAASKGRAQTVKRLLLALIPVVLMGALSLLYLSNGNILFAFLTAGFGVAMAIWVGSGTFVESMKRLFKIR